MVIRKLNKTKKGYVTVEAAMILPVFLVAVLTLGFLIQAVSAEETLFHTMVNQSRRISGEGSFHQMETDQLPPALAGIMESLETIQGSPAALQHRLRQQIAEEGYEGSRLRVMEYQYRWTENKLDDLVRIKASLQVDIPLPVMFQRNYLRQQQVVFRSFTGSSRKVTPVSYNELESEQEGWFVWVFPRAGERYHQESCSVIHVMAKEQVLTKETVKRYDPCKLCKPDPKALGSLVYCFPSEGSSFHRQDCHSVSRYVERMEKNDAQQRGYTPCKVCGG